MLGILLVLSFKPLQQGRGALISPSASVPQLMGVGADAERDCVTVPRAPCHFIYSFRHSSSPSIVLLRLC